jgi:hypothetical protein
VADALSPREGCHRGQGEMLTLLQKLAPERSGAEAVHKGQASHQARFVNIRAVLRKVGALEAAVCVISL